MKRYKLKKEARQFFDEKLHREVKPMSFWESETISERLLDEVEKVHVEYGIKNDEMRTDLSAWSSNEGEPYAHFKFTVIVNDIGFVEYERVKISEVMDEIQKVLNKYFKQI